MSQPFSQEDLNDAEEIDFDVEKEDWNIYHLKDGTTLKVKLVLSGLTLSTAEAGRFSLLGWSSVGCSSPF